MGDNFLKQQTKNFRRQRDAAMEDAKAPTLFKRPDVIRRMFSAIPDGNQTFMEGERLWAMPDPHGHRIILVRDCQKIGHIEGDGAKILLDTWPSEESPDVIPMDVKEVLGLSGVAELVLAEK
jgi:hypothetical protein